MFNIERKQYKGQALIEFAAVLPIFLVMLVFIFITMTTLYDLFTLHEAVREAARYRAASSPTMMSDADLGTMINQSFHLTGVYKFDAANRDGTYLTIKTNRAYGNVKVVEVTGTATRTMNSDILDITNFPPKTLTYAIVMNQEW